MDHPEWYMRGNQDAISNSGQSAAQGWNWGNTGIPAQSGFLHSVAWYRTLAGAGNAPSRIQVWDRQTQNLIFELTNIPDNGQVGWQTYTLAYDLSLVGGRQYTVSLWVDPGESWGQYPDQTPTHVPGAWSFAPVLAHSSANGTFGYPANVQGSVLPAVDMAWSSTGGGGGSNPANPADVESALNRWLSATENEHLNDIPYYLYTHLQTVQTNLDTAIAKIDAFNASFETALGPGGNFLTGAVRNYLQGLSNTIDLVFAQVDAAIPNTLTANQGVITAKLDAIDAKLGAQGGNPDPTNPDWSLTSTVNGSGDLIVETAADVYVLTITGWGAARRFNIYGGLSFFTFPMWWASHTEGRIGQYHTFMSLSTQLYEPGRRLPGVLIACPDDIEWTLEAWDYTP